MQEFIHFIQSGFLELTGFITGLLCVFLAIRNNIWNWPVAMISTVCYLVLFYQSRLYSDSALQIVFLGMQVYGWISWHRKPSLSNSGGISSMSSKQWGWVIVITLISTLAWGYLLPFIKKDQIFPYWDSLTTCISISAIILQALKKIENWFLWILVDIIYIPLYLVRELNLTAILYALFLAMAVWGALEWNKQLKKARYK